MSESSPGRPHSLLSSTIGLKFVMGATGVVLVGFVLAHMAGNLQVYLGSDTFNSYAQTLKGTPPLLWGSIAMKLVNPANKRKYTVIVVGTGLAGASAAATLAELGYHVDCFCFQDSPRRAHSIAAQGGINAAKNYQNDGDSVYRLFYDTVKGGDFRAREANVYRLAEVSVNIIDQCVAQGVPVRPRVRRPARQPLVRRRAGLAHLLRARPDRPAAAARRLPALERQIGLGNVKMFPRTEMLDLVVIDGHAAASSCATSSPARSSATPPTRGARTGGYGNVFYLSTNAKGCNVTATFRAYKRGAGFGNPCFTQIHPTCIPVSGDYQSKLTLMSESLRNDGRVWVPKQAGDVRRPADIPEAERDYYLERKYPSFGNLAPRDVASRAAKEACDEGRGVGPGDGRLPRLRRRDQAPRPRRSPSATATCSRCTSDHRREPLQTPMRIYPAVHYTMGGLWVDYNLMSTVPGLHARRGELLRPRRQPPRRLGADAGPRRRLLRPPVHDRQLPRHREAGQGHHRPPEFKQGRGQRRERQTSKLLSHQRQAHPDEFHRELGKMMWDHCGMARNEAGLKKALKKIPELREEFWKRCACPARRRVQPNLEKAGRVADFLEFGELMCLDALERDESCGGHFREEHQTPDGEAKRDDEGFMHAAVWEYKGAGQAPSAAQGAAGVRARPPRHPVYT
jgi:succinate dehydrogenase / fumarate reductase flavoprotein subunit